MKALPVARCAGAALTLAVGGFDVFAVAKDHVSRTRGPRSAGSQTCAHTSLLSAKLAILAPAMNRVVTYARLGVKSLDNCV
jgi:hypothetical protein